MFELNYRQGMCFASVKQNHDDAQEDYRIAHRLRDMQTLPYVVITNSHMSHVYNMYLQAFDTLRRIPEIKTVDDNDKACQVIQEMLQEHLSVIPRLVMGMLECESFMEPESMDKFMNTLLKSVSLPRAPVSRHA